MRHLIYLAGLCIILAACADDDSSLVTKVAPLSAEEAAALDACVQEVAECRATAGEDFFEACRELMECLPERRTAGTGERDWRMFCEGLEERCSGNDVDEALCEELGLRCEAARVEGLGDASSVAGTEPTTYAECFDQCMEDAALEESVCDERCEEAFGQP